MYRPRFGIRFGLLALAIGILLCSHCSFPQLV